MSLYHKYRPTELEQVIGNTETLEAIKVALSTKESHVFLIHGPSGCGKTTLARIIANKLECSDSDYYEMNSADVRGIDAVREISRDCWFAPFNGKSRVWVIDECHKMTGDAQNAFLKTLEDFPPHAYFILCTTAPQDLIPTIIRRCFSIEVSPLKDNLMKVLIKRVGRSEGFQITDDQIEYLTEKSYGSPGLALQFLEGMMALPESERTKFINDLRIAKAASIDLARALSQGAAWSTIAQILSSLKESKTEPEAIRRAVLGYCQVVLLKGRDEGLFGRIMEKFINPFYDTGWPQLTFACYSVKKRE